MPEAIYSGVLQEFADAGNRVDVFLRDDDVDTFEPGLLNLIHFLDTHRLPCNLAVIPGLLSSGAADYLRPLLAEESALVSLSQHGYRHINHEESGRKCEFGDSRTYEAQLADILTGREFFDEHFRGQLPDVFVPPWNRCSPNGLRAIKDAGFSIYSGWEGRSIGASYVAAEMGLKTVSANVDIFEWGKNVRLKEAAEVDYEIRARIETGRIGILLHHKLMEQKAFDLLAGLADQLRQFTAIRFNHLSSLGG